jgi:2-succinyl-5-enolpyruvyl-6-hydroxy-3-cyclohexene-1-carboxylate synthase
MIGAALAAKDKTHIAVMGDLAFFYDLNSLGNRHVPSNVRILLVNNGRGIEFRNYGHPAAEFGEDADPYMAAAGHYGDQSPELVKHYAQDLGFRYLSAGNKEEFLNTIDTFLDDKVDGPIVFEVFTKTEDESDSFKILRNLEHSSKTSFKQTLKGVLGDKGTRTLKKIVHK